MRFPRSSSLFLLGRTLVVATVLAGAAAAPAVADDILITSGSLEANGSMGNGPLVLDGDRGFTFRGSTLTGNYQPGICNGSPCFAGERISLFASWSGSDLLGVATLDGVTYPRVGSMGDTSSTQASLLVEFHGSFLLPPGSISTTIVVPFVFRAALYHQGGPDLFAGSGIATIDLRPVLGYPEERWGVPRVVYRLGSRLPAGWVGQDIGATQIQGRTSLVDDAFVVAGDGADIWGTADSFRFASQDLTGVGAITARVVTQQKTFPAPSRTTAALNVFAKAGVMIRESTDANAASAILDVKPDGELEFMVRYAAGESTIYIAGAMTPGANVWLRLSRGTGGQIVAAYSSDGIGWTMLAEVFLVLRSDTVRAGLAVTSHDPTVLNAAIFDRVTVTTAAAGQNLLVRGDFETYQPPALGLPGWVSDDQLRQVPAKSETNQPHSGALNGACWTTTYLDCGIFQEVTAPSSGTFTFTIYAAADRRGGLVGANVNGLTAASRDVAPGPFGAYGLYAMTFTAAAGDVIRVWMYSPAVPGYVVIDDASLTVAAAQARAVTSGTWTINAASGAFGSFSLAGDGYAVEGTYDRGEVQALAACGWNRCAAGTLVGPGASFVNQTIDTMNSFARGVATIDGASFPPFVEYGGALTLSGSAVPVPAATGTNWPELVSASTPFALSGTLQGYEVSGRREPKLAFELPLTGHGTATIDLLAEPGTNGSIGYRLFRVRYVFEP